MRPRSSKEWGRIAVDSLTSECWKIDQIVCPFTIRISTQIRFAVCLFNHSDIYTVATGADVCFHFLIFYPVDEIRLIVVADLA